jgi:hypothetical protein
VRLDGVVSAAVFRDDVDAVDAGDGRREVRDAAAASGEREASEARTIVAALN